MALAQRGSIVSRDGQSSARTGPPVERDRTADQSAQQHDDRIGQDRTRLRNSQQTSVNSIGKCTRYRLNEILPPQPPAAEPARVAMPATAPRQRRPELRQAGPVGSTGPRRAQAIVPVLPRARRERQRRPGRNTGTHHPANRPYPLPPRGRGPRAKAGAARWPTTNMTNGVTASATPRPIQPARCTPRGTAARSSPER